MQDRLLHESIIPPRMISALVVRERARLERKLWKRKISNALYVVTTLPA